MSFPASTILAFTAALKAGLEARDALEDVSVTDGPAVPGDEIREELIQLLDVDGEQVVHALNKTTQPRAEHMTLNVLITVQYKGRAQLDVNTRAFALFDELNQLLRGDPYLAAYYTGPGKVYGARVTTVKHTKRISTDQSVREAGLDVGVRWEGRI